MSYFDSSSELLLTLFFSIGNTPLHLAVMLGRLDCLKVLLSHDAMITVKNCQGWTPLAEAVSFGNREMSESPSLCDMFVGF